MDEEEMAAGRETPMDGRTELPPQLQMAVDNNSSGSGCFAGLSFVDIPFRLSRHLPRNDGINKFILHHQLLIARSRGRGCCCWSVATVSAPDGL